MKESSCILVSSLGSLVDGCSTKIGNLGGGVHLWAKEISFFIGHVSFRYL